MEKAATLLTALIGILTLCSWAIQQEEPIRKADWLIGVWENKMQRGSIYESWNKINDTELAGKSYILKGKDTVVFETVRLIQESGNLFYVPIVKNQNNGLPVRFALKAASATKLVFENPQHDFPQIIAYTKINADSLVAEISGFQNGKKRKEIFPMRKAN